MIDFILQYLVLIVLLPFIVYFCVKFGVVAYYKGKEFSESEGEKNED